MAQKGYIKNSLTKDLGAPEMANMFQGIFGSSGIMSLYENLACVKVDNNTVRMSAGAYNLSGHLLGIAKGTTEDLTIDSGTSGQNRNDLVVAEFVRNGGGLGVDTLHFTVVKGTSTSGTAADPALTQQDINAVGVTRQEALYRVKVTGTEISAVEKVAGSVSNLNLVDTTVASHLAETVSETIHVTRDLSLVGDQVISGFSKDIKAIDILATISGTISHSIGYNNPQYCITFFKDNRVQRILSSVVALGDSATIYASAKATINSDKTITLTWAKTGEPVGSATLFIKAYYHGSGE